jgi:hypothetical protein
MEQVLATRSVSITELKRSPTAVLEQAGDEPVAVLAALSGALPSFEVAVTVAVNVPL